MTPEPLPPSDLRFMGEGDDTFLEIADFYARQLRERCRLTSASTVLDVGCGYGRLLYGLRRGGWQGRYLGVDVLERHIGWCAENLADGRTEFRRLDVRNDRYNPDGTATAAAVDVGGSWDVVVFASVFTHMWPDDVQAYLRLARSAVTVDGSVFATWLLANQRSATSKWSLPHRRRWYCRYEDDEEPLHAVGYDERWVRWSAWRAGLRTEHVEYGWWSDRQDGPSGRGQDRIVFRPT